TVGGLVEVHRVSAFLARECGRREIALLRKVLCQQKLRFLAAAFAADIRCEERFNARGAAKVVNAVELRDEGRSAMGKDEMADAWPQRGQERNPFPNSGRIDPADAAEIENDRTG